LNFQYEASLVDDVFVDVFEGLEPGRRCLIELNSSVLSISVDSE